MSGSMSASRHCGLSAHTESAYRSDLRVLAERIAGGGEIPADANRWE